jgi:hypothetical protein
VFRKSLQYRTQVHARGHFPLFHEAQSC